MFTTGIIIDLKNIKEEDRKGFFILDKAVRAYSLDNNSELTKIELSGKYWTFTVDPTKYVLQLLYRSYKKYCANEHTKINVYEYAIINDDFNYSNMSHPEYIYTDEFIVNIRKITIDSDDMYEHGVDTFDFQKDILKDEDPFTTTLILNDYARMDGIVKEFIIYDYNKIK